MLCFVAGVTEQAKEIAPSAGERQLGYLRHWASEMLDRVVLSRKAGRPDALSQALLPDYVNLG